jgi:hypothetical protein
MIQRVLERRERAAQEDDDGVEQASITTLSRSLRKKSKEENV